MRIISDFHDYYDSAMAYGADEEVVYVRKTKDIVDPNDYQLGGGEYVPQLGRGSLPRLAYIGFCGWIIPAVNQYVYRDARKLWGSWEWCYSLEEIEAVRPRGKDGKDPWSAEEAAVFEVGKYKNLQLFRDYNCPVFLAIPERYHYRRNMRELDKVVKLNQPLGEMNFARVFDPFSAYQEIEMFLSGVLGWPGNATAEVADKHRFEGHGYNKESFRKTEPTGRKARKKRK